MIELTPQQKQELETGELIIPTNTTCVLIHQKVYERIQSLLGGEDWPHDAYQAAMEVFARDGWDDPRMDVYDERDPRRRS